ncbi:MAG: YicC/YloC family endoribonuclease [Rubinisphaera brasiliensis]|uniref:YicC-like domain-containing protein n=1 Tax=Rubinisphaera brasiliensis (strain ATCC 49424 / DSM 5305 / JCM 21570 / IAM 15109 / NBRC 103401 / IFAM 1448) TaxID=756272 RepID=F0SKF0_RUBBR|nr:YicC/YloC family endoribonuclease [Rubinisphaera brasiliensis]ADY61931.1 Conserved hypothetical protein CHP00255 [Rubinisphaera brasiliensis DSM 5305]
MILSMTGIGRSRHQDEQIQATVEIRAVNNKYLKLNLRLPDALSGREPQIDRIVRQYLERGTLTVNCQLTWVQKISPFAIDERVLEQYLRQAQATAERLHLRPPEDLRDFLHLPGVVADQSASLDDEGEAEWLIFEPALRNALESLQTFRRTEGDSMEAVLTEHCREISEAVDAIQARSPVVVDNYRQKLKDRVNDWLTQQGVSIEDHDILREVCIFSDRSDINEEITRLHSHLDQFRAFLSDKGSPGRKLDFLCQEMFRETNTIGSKANDIEISHRVVSMKATIEKIREIVQNIE